MARGSTNETTETAGRPSRASLIDSLGALARTFGLEARLAEVLRGAHGDPAARDVPGVLRLAGKAGLRCRRLKLAWDDLPRLAARLPAIVAFTDATRMLLVETRTADGTAVAVLQDPRATGADPVVVDRIRFETVWTGEVILVRPALRSRGSEVFGWRAITGLMREEPRLIRDATAATLALAALACVPILLVQLLMSRVLPYKSERSLLILGLGAAAALVIEAVFRALRGRLVARLAARTEARLSARLFDRLLALPVAAIEALPLGEARQAFGALRLVGETLGSLWPRLALDLGVFVFVLPLMAYLDWPLTFVVVVFGGLAAAGLVAALVPLRRESEKVADARGAREAFLVQSLAGMGAIKALALAPGRIAQWDRLTAMLGKARLGEARIADRIAALVLPAERVLVVGLLALGIGTAALRGEPAPLAPLIAVVLLVQRLLDPLASLAAMARAQGAARAAVRRLGALVNQPAEAAGGTATVLRGGLAFDRVRFRYPEAATPALRSVSFTLEPGATLGIMGRSGAGKTTIARLAQRLLEPQGGAIRIDGIPLGDFDLERLRRAVAVVPQTSTIFAGTIRETITAARPDTSFEEMTRAARDAGADEFIDRLPRGYETRLADGAPSLSSGQRQRLALARALVATPRILILDEALSALDAEIEASVEASLREARKGYTTIVISHRLSALMACDTIMVMADGEVRDIGSHHELLERCDIYGAAWSRQQGAIEGDAPSEGLLALS